MANIRQMLDVKSLEEKLRKKEEKSAQRNLERQRRKQSELLQKSTPGDVQALPGAHRLQIPETVESCDNPIDSYKPEPAKNHGNGPEGPEGKGPPVTPLNTYQQNTASQSSVAAPTRLQPSITANDPRGKSLLGASVEACQIRPLIEELQPVIVESRNNNDTAPEATPASSQQSIDDATLVAGDTASESSSDSLLDEIDDSDVYISDTESPAIEGQPADNLGRLTRHANRGLHDMRESGQGIRHESDIHDRHSSALLGKRSTTTSKRNLSSVRRSNPAARPDERPAQPTHTRAMKRKRPREVLPKDQESETKTRRTSRSARVASSLPSGSLKTRPNGGEESGPNKLETFTNPHTSADISRVRLGEAPIQSPQAREGLSVAKCHTCGFSRQHLLQLTTAVEALVGSSAKLSDGEKGMVMLQLFLSSVRDYASGLSHDSTPTAQVRSQEEAGTRYTSTTEASGQTLLDDTAQPDVIVLDDTDDDSGSQSDDGYLDENSPGPDEGDVKELKRGKWDELEECRLRVWAEAQKDWHWIAQKLNRSRPSVYQHWQNMK